MTTTQPFSGPSLTADADDDMMQIGTSPYPHNDDFDIELDDDQVEFVEDNSMLDDATDTFEQMQHDDPEPNPLDDEMHDETADEDGIEVEDHRVLEPKDSELHLDQDQPTQQPATVHDLATSGADEGFNDSTIYVQQPLEEQSTDINDEELYDEEEEYTNLVSTTIQPEDPAEAQLQVEDDNYDNEEVEIAAQDPTTQSIDFAAQQALPEVDTGPVLAGDEYHDPTDAVEESDDRQENLETHEPEQLELQEIQDPYVPGEDGQPDVPTSTSRDKTPAPLHPVIITYEGEDFYLFGDDIACFLQDTALAFETMDKLLAALRELLNESLEHNDEIVIDIPSLGLHICEDSKYASQLTLAQIVDTYMLLSQNEQLAEIEPLRCQLTHRVCLETQLAYLLNSAREGKTYSEILNEHVVSPEEEQYEAIEPVGDDLDENVQPQDTNDVENTIDHLAENFPPTEDAEPQESADAEADDSGDQRPGPEDGIVHHEDVTANANPQDDSVNNQEEKQSSTHVEDQAATLTAGETIEKSVENESDDIDSDSSHTIENELNGTASNDIDAEEDAHNQTIDSVENTGEEEDLFAEEAAHEFKASDVNGGTPPPTSSKPIARSPSDDSEQLAPITPSKSANIKRKLIDDDDLIDLELTPEPKRTRSS